MKVAVIAPSPVPFVLGGAERLVNGLVRAINELTPHDAELLKLPSREHNLPDLMATYRAFRALDVSHFDLVISTKYPSWMIDHPHHVVYMLHPLRGLYETYPADWPGEPQGPFEEPALAQLVTAASGPVDGPSRRPPTARPLGRVPRRARPRPSGLRVPRTARPAPGAAARLDRPRRRAHQRPLRHLRDRHQASRLLPGPRPPASGHPADRPRRAPHRAAPTASSRPADSTARSGSTSSSTRCRSSPHRSR